MTCASCRYCVKRSIEVGICKRMPPHSYAGFPVVALRDWCGEWAPVQSVMASVVPVVEEKPVPVPQPLLKTTALDKDRRAWWQKVLG